MCVVANDCFLATFAISSLLMFFQLDYCSFIRNIGTYEDLCCALRDVCSTLTPGNKQEKNEHS